MKIKDFILMCEINLSKLNHVPGTLWTLVQILYFIFIESELIKYKFRF